MWRRTVFGRQVSLSSVGQWIGVAYDRVRSAGLTLVCRTVERCGVGPCPVGRSHSRLSDSREVWRRTVFGWQVSLSSVGQ